MSEKYHISNASYAGLISRYLGVTGQQVHNVNYEPPKYYQEFEQFKAIVQKMAEEKRAEEERKYDFE
ncbi:MAG: hypothetical protein EOM20_03255 [Spartobacteria bacterium]|nr:hypothetical protein [Spartobacteria bacterium]